MAFLHRYKCSTEWKEFQRSNGRFWSSVFVDCEATGQWSTINLPCECKFMCHVHAICWHSIASIIHKGVKNVVFVTLMREYVRLLQHQILIWYYDRGVLHQPPAQPARQQQAGAGQWLRLQQPHGARRHRHLPLPSWGIQQVGSKNERCAKFIPDFGPNVTSTK